MVTGEGRIRLARMKIASFAWDDDVLTRSSVHLGAIRIWSSDGHEVLFTPSKVRADSIGITCLAKHAFMLGLSGGRVGCRTKA